MEKSQDEIKAILPDRDQYIVNTSEFDQVKSRLAAIENRRKVDDQKQGNKPTLRRTDSNTSKNGSKDGDTDQCGGCELSVSDLFQVV